MRTFEQVQKLAFLIKEILADFESSALINQEGQLLGLKYESLADLGTFTPLVQMARKYFPLNDGDVVITNDPYSGGNSLSVMNFITAIQLADQTLYFAVRTRFQPRMATAKKLEDEGLRIPPTPLVTNSQLNEPILMAISSHPQSPQDFESRVRQALQTLSSRAALIKAWGRKQGGCFSKAVQKTFISETRNQMQAIISELASGENRLDLNFETGELIRLKTEIKAGEIHFDFSGSSQSKRIFTTNHTTHGSCVGAVLSFLGQDFPVNEGVLSVITVTTPQDCLLNAKFPAPIFEGLAEVCSVLASGITQSLAEITSTKTMGLNGSIPTILSFEFSPEKILFQALPGGTGASKESAGLDSFYLWSTNKANPSIEDIERNFPVLFRESSIRANSGGKGQYLGGNGMVQEIEVLADCSVKWLLGHRHIQSKGLKEAQAGLSSEIYKISQAGEKLNLSQSNGSVSLLKGDRIIAMSAGGGGFGKSAAKD